VARYAWLALPQHLRQLTDGQLHPPEQRQYAQPRRIAKGAKNVERGVHASSYKEIFI
jgi:hypothetical protein